MPVENSPVFVFLGGVRPSLLNKTSPNCLGDPILNLTPDNLKIVFSRIFILFSNSDDKDFKYLVLSIIPLVSISIIEGTKDFSK